MKKILKVWILAFGFLILSGCLVYPIERTYYEPNFEDGELSSSQSCGYHRTSKDSLRREIDGLTVFVSPYYKAGNNFSVSISFRSRENDVTVKPEDFILKDRDTNQEFNPVQIDSDLYKPRTNLLYYTIGLSLEFPVRSENISAVSIIFPKGSVLRNDKDLKVERFRFTKTKKSDVYYASINC